MIRIEIGFLVLVCIMLCGCHMSSHTYYTESECLSKLQAAGYARYVEELGEPLKSVGTPINNPSLLIGRWACVYEMEYVIVGFLTPEPSGHKSQLYEILEFRTDGTYSLKMTMEGQNSVNSDIVSEGSWKMSCGTLEMVQSKTSMRVADLSPKSQNKRVAMRRMKVLDCGTREILIEPSSSKDYRDMLPSAHSNYARNRNQRITTGIDNRGYAVMRMFIPMQNDGRGEMHIAITSPKRYKYIGPVVPTRVIVSSDGQRQVTVQKAQKGRVSAISTVGKPTYSLESFNWEDGRDFAATFRVKMHGECSIDSFFTIRQAFDTEVRNAYLQSHPSADSRHLQIEVRPNLENGMISGRVAVLTIVPASLTYDANTRRGKLSVRFNAGQAEEARAWIRKNIETLARDKNIALKTGTLPPEATYYSLGEKIDGNVMEIEFRTE